MKLRPPATDEVLPSIVEDMPGPLHMTSSKFSSSGASGMPSVDLQEQLSLSFSTSVMQLAKVAQSIKANPHHQLSNSELTIMQHDEVHVYTQESIRVVNTFDGIFLKACSFVFITLFVLLLATFLESVKVHAPYLYNIGLLLRQSAIVLSAKLFFQSTSLQPNESENTEDVDEATFEDLSDTKDCTELPLSSSNRACSPPIECKFNASRVSKTNDGLHQISMIANPSSNKAMSSSEENKLTKGLSSVSSL